MHIMKAHLKVGERRIKFAAVRVFVCRQDLPYQQALEDALLVLNSADLISL
jgi:hypothetical protein